MGAGSKNPDFVVSGVASVEEEEDDNGEMTGIRKFRNA